MSTSTMVPIQSWYLEYIEGTSKKFYRVHLTASGLVSTGWGRLYTSGQCSVVQMEFEDAKAIALRQVYAKAAKGYRIVVDDFKWEVSQDILNSARDRHSSADLDVHYEQARENPLYAGDRAVVARLYDSFIERAEACMKRAKEEGFEEVLPEFKGIQKAFEGIKKKNEREVTTIKRRNQMLMQKLMGV